ncbi:apolipoprotein N-acyltransferase [Emcibacter nanhaiensis]|uniref:Apolipoprotein N-acyltransferase n=1 Tax=Emcibacter nanhaiensis TaxID=1505037 RepID=A0A501PI60_9PROT|nr:apolipoprotein N-acyltransferase [Emcibacter nanhaiensis]TPD59758.1 apolipoprotein N-acyltransferase [Emcibacter nanhaiensis]
MVIEKAETAKTAGHILLEKIVEWTRQRSSLQLVLLSFAAGLLSALSFAPFYALPLLWISYPFLCLALRDQKKKSEAFAVAWWFGFGQFFMGFLWIANSFYLQDDVPGWMGYFAVGSLAGMLAIYSGLVGLVMNLFWRRFDRKRALLPSLLVFAGLWNLSEWARGHFFTGFPWNLSGYAWGFSDSMLQSASLWGIYGLGPVTMLFALAPLVFLALSGDRAKMFLAAGIYVLVFAGLFFFGEQRLQQETNYVEDVGLRLVQPNINQRDKWARDKRADNFLDYLAMSDRRGKDGITHIIWPETAVIYFLDQEPSRRYLIADMLGDDGVLLTGFPRREWDRDGMKIYNSFIAIDSSGQIGALHDKTHLVPFGEYIPAFFRVLLRAIGFERAVGGLDYSPGPGQLTQYIPGTPPFGVLVCYEIIFPGEVVDPQNRPDWLLNITNDAWYGTMTGPYQHFLQTRVRAIEEGLPVVRSAGTGISAVIDSYGRVIKSIDLQKRGVIDQMLPKKLVNLTYYARFGDIIFVIATLIIIMIGTVAARRWSSL